jgi:hypothetical protein
MVDSSVLEVSSRVFKFSSFPVTFLIVNRNYFIVSIHQNLITKVAVIFSITINPDVIHPFTQTHTSNIHALLQCLFHGLFFILRTNHALISSGCCHLIVQCCTVCSVLICVFILNLYLTQNTHCPLYHVLHAQLFLQPEHVPDREHSLL